ncbi:MAG TPA: tape measure protein [Candidatus Mediterraneibacter intestinigallinarum]|nr:tape measure protein [Candidatus Mediterraneibacter intestinigallinarum]
MADTTLSVKLTGDSSGLDRAIKNANKAIKSFSSTFDSIGKKISSVGSTLTDKITKPALAATSALSGITLVKGFGRLVGIDDARAKLSALGNDAQTVEQIMDSALTSVKGTSFGLEEAATTAANAVAAGIKPGQELTDYLTMTADAAAIAGISMSEMGSIINQVQTGQTAYTEDLNQLADRGLPIYQWLADEAGVAASQVKALASDGQISSEMLFNAIQNNIGGAAQIIGEKSFSAALANIGASISRIGANFLDAGGQGGGFFSQLKPLMSDFNASLSTLETKASELGVKFGAAFASIVQKVQQVKAQFDSLSPTTQGIIIKVAGIGSAIAVGIGPALKVIGPLVSGFGSVVKVLSLFASPIGVVVTAIAALAAGFSYLMQTNEGFRNTVMSIINAVLPGIQSLISVLSANLMPLFQTIITTVAGIASAVIPAFQSALANLVPVIIQIVNTISNIAATVLPVIISLINQLAPFLVQLADVIGQIFAALAPMIAQLVNTLFPVIQNIITVISNAVQSVMPAVVAILNVIMSVIQALAPVIMDILSVVISVVSNIISTISPIISFVGMVISQIMAVITPIVTFIANIIATIIQVIGTILGTVTGIFSTVYSIISGVWSNISQFISTAINAISTIISGITNTVGGVFNGIYSVVSTIMGKVRNYITSVFNGIKTAWNGLTSFVSGIFSGIGSAVNELVSQVKGFVNGVISGINAAIGLINMIPGVSIGRIPYLAHGTDDWQGGFAYMNEGGRGELTYLPNGAQVIPHDISVKYAKEAARNANDAEPLSLEGLYEGISVIVNTYPQFDGTPLKETFSDYTIKKIGNQQRSNLRSKGAYA